jgi:hypothetical protein
MRTDSYLAVKPNRAFSPIQWFVWYRQPLRANDCRKAGSTLCGRQLSQQTSRGGRNERAQRCGVTAPGFLPRTTGSNFTSDRSAPVPRRFHRDP